MPLSNYSVTAPCGAGAPSSLSPLFPLSIYFLIFCSFLLFPFFHWLYLFSSFVHPFLRFQAGGRRKHSNPVLVCCVCVICIPWLIWILVFCSIWFSQHIYTMPCGWGVMGKGRYDLCVGGRQHCVIPHGPYLRALEIKGL